MCVFLGRAMNFFCPSLGAIAPPPSPPVDPPLYTSNSYSLTAAATTTIIIIRRRRRRRRRHVAYRIWYLIVSDCGCNTFLVSLLGLLLADRSTKTSPSAEVLTEWRLDRADWNVVAPRTSDEKGLLASWLYGTTSLRLRLLPFSRTSNRVVIGHRSELIRFVLAAVFRLIRR